MVVVKTVTPSEIVSTNSTVSTNSELQMESGYVIRYVAPVPLDPEGNNEHQQVVMLAQEKRLLFGDVNDELDKWIGVGEMCQSIDNLVEIEKESDLFQGKDILEVGFTSGLPSVYAYAHGAKSVTIYSDNPTTLDSFVKPTLRRNNVRNEINYILGEVDQLKNTIASKKFDVILAPELVNTKQEYFEEIHDMLDHALSDNGIVIFSGRTHYHTCDGNIKVMLDLIKSKNRFDIVDRSPLPKNDTAPRKVIQLIRKFC